VSALDESISELVRVRSWDDYVGQHKLKSHLDIKVRAAVRDDRKLDHTLFVGPPGSGKSTIVDLIADRLGDDLLCLPMAMNYDDFVYEVEGFPGGVIFLDEIHNAPKAFQERLQFGLHDGYLPDSYGDRVSTHHVTFIAATSPLDQQRLIAPLVQRFKYRPSWDPYSEAEMAEIVAGMAGRANTEVDSNVCIGLARAAGGNPRVVQDLVAAARDLASVDLPVTVESVLDLAGLDSDGLTRDHLDYLRALHALRGVAGLTTLVSVSGMSAQTIQDLERVLVMRGLVRRTSAGRKLMATGRAKIDQADGGRRTGSDRSGRERPLSA
jgi:holliday junction DNA helicase RuvB